MEYGRENKYNNNTTMHVVPVIQGYDVMVKNPRNGLYTATIFYDDNNNVRLLCHFCIYFVGPKVQQKKYKKQQILPQFRLTNVQRKQPLFQRYY